MKTQQKSPTQRQNKAKLFMTTIPPTDAHEQEQYDPLEIFKEEAPSLILNALDEQLAQWNRLNAQVEDIEKVLPSLPSGEGITLKGFYEVILPKIKTERAQTLRHIRRLQQQYDKVFGTSHFVVPQYKSSVDIEALKERIDIVSIISEYVVLRKAGTRHRGLCPFHQEKTPSFTVFDDHYHCYGCQAHGDAISFVQRIKNIDFKQALSELVAVVGA